MLRPIHSNKGPLHFRHVALPALLLLATPSGSSAQCLHGAGAFTHCTPCALPGDSTSCLFQVTNIDQCGDVLAVKTATDVYTTDTGNVGVPAIGDLPIIAVNCGPAAN